MKTGNDSGGGAVKMGEGITQGKRDETVKKGSDMVAVRGDACRGGSVYGRKKRVGAKIGGQRNAAGKNGCNPRKGQGKSCSDG